MLLTRCFMPKENIPVAEKKKLAKVAEERIEKAIQRCKEDIGKLEKKLSEYEKKELEWRLKRDSRRHFEWAATVYQLKFWLDKNRPKGKTKKPV